MTFGRESAFDGKIARNSKQVGIVAVAMIVVAETKWFHENLSGSDRVCLIELLFLNSNITRVLFSNFGVNSGENKVLSKICKYFCSQINTIVNI